ncbi:hypothetical protein [Kribbella sp. CA-294648]|uniref:hypothetical protein n=1 Tax=Kribbella sp. CA-294648 TaxID=3239948 RepID=UPI003D89FF21
MAEQLMVPSHVSLDQAKRLLGDSVVTLAEAVRYGVLVLYGRGIGFRHKIARRAIEQSLPLIGRRALNALSCWLTRLPTCRG